MKTFKTCQSFGRHASICGNDSRHHTTSRNITRDIWANMYCRRIVDDIARGPSLYIRMSLYGHITSPWSWSVMTFHMLIWPHQNWSWPVLAFQADCSPCSLPSPRRKGEGEVASRPQGVLLVIQDGIILIVNYKLWTVTHSFGSICALSGLN